MTSGDRRRAREDTRGRLQTPARLAQPRPPALRTSHFPDPPAPSLRALALPLDRHRGTPGSVEALIRRGQGDASTEEVPERVAGTGDPPGGRGSGAGAGPDAERRRETDRPTGGDQPRHVARLV